MISTAGGVNLSIGGAVVLVPNAPPTLMEYEAQSYVDLGEVEDGGQVGDESSTISFTSLKDGRVRKLKGPRDAGTMAVVCGEDNTDEGQAAMIAAEETVYDYYFRVEFNDPATVGGDGSIFYFAAKVMGDRTNIGNVSNVIKRTFNLGVNTPITPGRAHLTAVKTGGRRTDDESRETAHETGILQLTIGGQAYPLKRTLGALAGVNRLPGGLQNPLNPSRARRSDEPDPRPRHRYDRGRHPSRVRCRAERLQGP